MAIKIKSACAVWIRSSLSNEKVVETSGSEGNPRGPEVEQSIAGLSVLDEPPSGPLVVEETSDTARR